MSGCGNSAATGPWLPGEGLTLPLGGSAFATLTCQPDGSYSIVEGGDCIHDDPETAIDERVTLADAGGASWGAAPADDYISQMTGYPAWSCSPGQAPSFPPVGPSGPPAFTPTPGGVTIGGGKAFRCRNELGNPTGTATDLVGSAGHFDMKLESEFGRVSEITVQYNPETLQLISYGPADPSHPARMCFNPDLPVWYPELAPEDQFVVCRDESDKSTWWPAFFPGGKGQDWCDLKNENGEWNAAILENLNFGPGAVLGETVGPFEGGYAYLPGVTYNCGSQIICAIEDE